MIDNSSPLRLVHLYEVIATPNYRDEYEQDFVDTTAANMAINGYDPAHAMEVYETLDGYPIIDGNTRNKAALQGSTYSLKTHLPQMMVWVCVKPKPKSDADTALAQFQANHNRRATDDLSNAKAFKRMLDGGKTYADIKAATGCDKTYVDYRLALLDLVPEIQTFAAKRQIGIKFCYAMRDLDSNRQRIALRHYNTRKPLLEDFIKFCGELLEQQIKDNEANQLFSLQALEMIADTIADKIGTESRKSRADLEAENEKLRQTLIKDRQFAIDYAKKKQAKIVALSQQLAALQAMLQANTAQTQAAA